MKHGRAPTRWRGVDESIVRLLRPLLAWAIRRAMKDRLPSRELKGMVQGAWRTYAGLAQDLPAEPTLGARLMLRLAALTVALFKAMVTAGLTEAEARERTSQVTWLVYERLAAPPWSFTRLLARDPLARMRRAMDLFMRFPYGAPGYDMRYVQAEGEVVAFDVHRCPVAEYFARQGLSELCVSAFCNLDYPLAEKWGVVLERPQTLAAGGPHCDFRYRPRPTPG